jgi:cytochrome c-type biogenesis protein CcsB
MSSAQLFNLATAIYFIAMLLLAVVMVLRNRRLGTLAVATVWCGFVAHSAAIGLRWIESYRLPGEIGHAPLSNLYESVIFFAWSIVLIYLIIDLRLRQRAVGVFVVPFALLAMCWAQLWGNDAIEPLVPALQSNWLTYHVVTCFIGYAAFAVGCGVSIMYLVKSASVASRPAEADDLLPGLDVLDALNYKAIMIGFPFLTLGIVTGAAWANYAWGTYWSWDPKETWSLIVWFIYAAFLHARLTRGWSGRRTAWLSILGFVATLFCYLGVNLLLSGLHSYGG